MSKLLFVALAAMVCVAAGATVKSSYSSTADCKDATVYQTFTAGQCQNTGADESKAYYCASNNVYVVTFNHVNCSAETAHEIVEYPTTCGATYFGFTWSCEGSDSPALPTGQFPPSDYSVGTNYVNNTARDGKVSACQTGNGVVSYRSAERTNYCIARSGDDKSETMPSSKASYCTKDGSYGGDAVFGSADCSGAIKTAEFRKANTCYLEATSGTATSGSCASSSTDFPSQYPTSGYAQYTTADCSDVPTVTAFPGDNSCFDAQTLQFSQINGTDYATHTRFSSATAGACTTAVETKYFPTGVCTKVGEGTYVIVAKDLAPSDGATAASIQVSMVAAIVAIVAALFAGRSL